MRAYNIEIETRSVAEADPRGDGWCFGLPPGIDPEKWPLDVNTGYPLAHGFTLRLPDDYRIHGPEVVALSFFATAHGEADRNAEIAALLGQPNAPEPSDAARYVFWMSERLSHPRLARMQDLLGGSYAVILLSEAEYRGPFCPVPVIRPNGLRERIAPPGWLMQGRAALFFERAAPEDRDRLLQLFGEVPPADPAYNRRLRLVPRTEDPNAGIPPREEWDAAAVGYRSPYYWEGDEVADETYREEDWAADHLPDHLGGTMRPAQGIPEISPYYLEFEDYLGGYDFNGGNAWLDLQTLTFDWAQ